MKKLLVITVILLAISLPVIAAEFPDVPADHWAYASISTLAADGIIQGYPDGTFGGKRAMTRYEFAEALAKAIPAIEAKLNGGTGVAGPAGPQGEMGPAGPAGPGGNPEEMAALKKLVDEFKDELAALGVDVEGLRRDVAALNDRVTAVEKEQSRVVFNGVADVIATGGVNNFGQTFDKDSRATQFSDFDNRKRVVANSKYFDNFDLGIKGRVSDNSSVNVLFNTGNYTDYALGATNPAEAFTLWTMNVDTAVSFGPLGKSHLVIGRFPFQLTPLTLKFVNPDSYNYVARLGNGDFVLDGARAGFNFGPVALTAFASKTVDLSASKTGFMVPDVTFGAGTGTNPIEQLGGARALLGIGSDGNLGLTWYQAGPGEGKLSVYGADVTKSFGSIGLAGEYALTRPSDQLITALAGNADALKHKNEAWNGKLNWASGNLAIAGGYTSVASNYIAPGYWSDYGAAVNLKNVTGETANVSYTINSKLSLSGDAAFLKPKDKTTAVFGRENASTSPVVAAVTEDNRLNKLTSWKAGLKYGLTATNSVDLGYENVTWDPTGVGVSTTEKYITFGLGHTFNPNASFKMLYQIIEYRAGLLDPYASGTARGGRAAAQVQMKF